MNSQSKQDHMIDVFGNNNINNPMFNCNDLKLLLKYGEQRHIPFNICLDCNQIDSLLYCADYLAVGDEIYTITKDKIIFIF